MRRAIDGASLALFRIGFGVCVVWEVLRYLYYDWVNDLFIKPAYLFHFFWLPIAPWPRGGMYVHFFIVGLAAFCVSLGLFYRVAAWIVALGLAYIFFLDLSYSLDLNHLYLMVLLAFLLATMPASNVWSIDNRLFGRESRSVPLWTLLTLRSQIFLVFLYAGIAKLSPEWLNSQPASRILANHASSPWLEPFFRLPEANTVVKFGGLALDLLLPWLLLVPATRKVSMAIAAIFLAINAFAFPIGVFPAIAMITLSMFLKPSWPRRNPIGIADVTPHPSRLALVLVPFYLAIQVLLPLAALLYPSPSAWSEEGHFFGWRMMGLDKSGTLVLTVRNPGTGLEATWDPARDLTPRQIYSMSTRPLLVHQYARHIADQIEQHEHIRPQVMAKQIVKLGNHVEQLMIDPARDLASEPYQWGHYDWLLPLAP